MTRTLVLIAGAGFLVCVACLSIAAALGWRGAWHRHWGWTAGADQAPRFAWFEDRTGQSGASGTREIAWSGADGLDLDLPADVRFTQGPAPGKLVITGPAEALNRLQLVGSQLRYQQDEFDSPRLDIVMTAPNVHRFAIRGDGRITINGYDQDELDLDVSGDGAVKATGKARAVRVDISGDGAVDLGALKADQAYADISGAGEASLAPASAADLHISGSGEIDLLTHPARLTSDVTGDGRIEEGGDPTSQPG